MYPLFYSVNAQEIGVRFGEMAGNNVGIDAALRFNNSRLHTSVSFGEGVGLDVIYDFVYSPMTKTPKFYYYMGIGLTTLFYSDFELGAVGEIGFEYRFKDTPLVLGLDYRPSVIIIEKTAFHWNGFGFNIRYIIH